MNIIETVNITKKFGDFVANNAINLSVAEGEIKAIVGENGAGKSTLMNMLYGLIQPTSGKILIRGEEVHFSSPIDAIGTGLGMVHQHFKLVPSLTICENILLGIEVRKKSKIGKLPFIDKKRQFELTQAAVDRYKFDLDVKEKVENISVGQKQQVEIMKMLYRNVDLLILDEPTAVLTPQEVDAFITSMKELKAQGKTIIVITHKLSEVMNMSDSVTVIKRGQVVGKVKTKETNERELAQMMVGRDVVLNVKKDKMEQKEQKVIYKLDHVSTQNRSGKEVLSDINFEVQKGEVLGIAGVEGNGQSELLKVLTGVMTTSKGKIIFEDKDITNWWPKDIRKTGIGMIHEDRYAQSLCRDMTISENVIAGYSYKYSKFGLFNSQTISAKRNQLITDFDIRIADLEGNVSQLSGGNAQKLVIAREFDAAPRLIIASQPTRGVDVGSIEFIHKRILDLQKQGVSVVLISSELSEIMSLSDRIAVMYKGKIIGVVNANNTTKTEIGLLMAGVVKEKELQ